MDEPRAANRGAPQVDRAHQRHHFKQAPQQEVPPVDDGVLEADLEEFVVLGDLHWADNLCSFPCCLRASSAAMRSAATMLARMHAARPPPN